MNDKESIIEAVNSIDFVLFRIQFSFKEKYGFLAIQNY